MTCPRGRTRELFLFFILTGFGTAWQRRSTVELLSVVHPPTDQGYRSRNFTSAGTAVPWPNPGWNSWKPGEGVTRTAFYHVNALRIGPDGKLWIVDSGAAGPGQPCLPGAARLFRFDTTTGSLDRVYALDSGTKPLTYIDDVRFNDDHAYLTDAGTPGILVLELKTGKYAAFSTTPHRLPTCDR